MKRSSILHRFSAGFRFLLVLFLFTALAGCESQPTQPTATKTPQQLPFDPTGEDLLIDALEELHTIADWAESNVGSFENPPGSGRTTKPLLFKLMADTVLIYGEDVGGVGAVVTERHTYPKGLPLISVRRTYGGTSGETVSELSRYISHQDLADDRPEQYIRTEIYGLSDGRILTHVERNGLFETYTFRTPVITRDVSADGSVQVTSRYGAGTAVVTEVRSGAGDLIRLARSYGAADGSVYRRTENSDGTWRTVRVVGQGDGSILREITAGP
ncbi:MAG: hypothetical protein WBG01_03565 [Bacteroidota bacterium]